MAKNPNGKQRHVHINPYAAHKDHPGSGGILGKKQLEREDPNSKVSKNNPSDQKDHQNNRKVNPLGDTNQPNASEYLIYGKVKLLKKEVDPARGFTRKEAETISPQLQDIVEQLERYSQSQHVQVLDGPHKYYVYVSEKGIASLPHIVEGNNEQRSNRLKGFYGKTNNPNEIIGFKPLRCR